MPNVHKHLEWTLERAAYEFGMDRKTLSKRVTALGIEPCYKGKGSKERFYSTAQMAQAVFGDLEAERIRETKENADKLALQNAKARAELVSTEVVLRVYANLAVTVRQIVKHSGLSEVEKHELLKNIRQLKVSDLLEENQSEVE